MVGVDGVRTELKLQLANFSGSITQQKTSDRLTENLEYGNLDKSKSKMAKVLAVVAALVVTGTGTSTDGFSALSGASKTCVGGKIHSLKYNT